MDKLIARINKLKVWEDVDGTHPQVDHPLTQAHVNDVTRRLICEMDDALTPKRRKEFANTLTMLEEYAKLNNLSIPEYSNA